MVIVEESLTTGLRLTEILNNMDIFHQSIPEDSCLVIFDTEKILGYLPGEQIDLGLKVGSPISNLKGTVSYKALEEGKTLREERGPEKFGVSYIASSVPIFENGKVVGVFSIAISNEKGEILQKGAEELSAMVEEMSATTEQVSQASTEVASGIQDVSFQTQQLNGNLENIDSILSFINEIASMSHLLGINAAIEAARAGEHGKGFSVVASEVRKMGDQSKTAIKDIQEKIDLLTKSIRQINESVHQIAAFTEEHSASMEELHATFEQISKTTEMFMRAAISNK